MSPVITAGQVIFRSRRARWLIWSAIYVLGLVAFMLLSTNSDTGPGRGWPSWRSC